MDPRFYEYYDQELRHIKETAAEFAREFPKIAQRLTLDGVECSDPYVERLLEGFAFLAARVQLKLDAEFPNFTQHLLEIIYPNFLAPTPSLAIVRFEPDFGDPDLAGGITVPRGTRLRARPGGNVDTVCEFRSAHNIELWPLEVAAAKFIAFPPELPRDVDCPDSLKASLRIRLTCRGDASFDKLPLDRLDFYISGDERVATRVYEQVFGGCAGILVQGTRRGQKFARLLPVTSLQRLGFYDDDALLPPAARSFRGYRLLQEYAAFPARYLFFRLAGLREALQMCEGKSVELSLLLTRADNQLENLVDTDSLCLFATPAVNLFEKPADPIDLTFRLPEYHVVADRGKSLDYEIHSVTAVTGQGSGMEFERPFRPLYASQDDSPGAGDAFYTLRRELRVPTGKKRQHDSRTSYTGTEVYLSIVDTQAAPFPANVRQLSVMTVCSNRDLPILIAQGAELECDLPVSAVRCIRGPSLPLAPRLEGAAVWQSINHLALNYLSLTDTTPAEGAQALRQMLELYGLTEQSPMRKQLHGVRAVEVKPIVRRLPSRGPIALGRGLEIRLTCDATAFEGMSPFLLGAVLEEFFARHASLNAITETVLIVQGRGEIMRWKPRIALRPVL
ncbi:MAG: type VI secretion system baseplate subunit TssF [Rhodocyclaceae bacterium]|nr:type VI secretion system baseplate subunit TssF [Rhodocyclaceae bacterium]MBX3668199.1 type VI secretion system baseplate subunit TssF [Rhodocyclaceae bacterium]